MRDILQYAYSVYILYLKLVQIIVMPLKVV